MIEKLGDKFNMGDISGKFSFNVNYSRSRFSFSALKSGCLMIGIGLGLLIAFFICSFAFLITLPAERQHGMWNSRQALFTVHVYSSSAA